MKLSWMITRSIMKLCKFYIPLRWGGGSVRLSVLRMALTLIVETLRCFRFVIPLYQGKTATSLSLNVKTISYHTVSSEEEMLNYCRLNWKISPFLNYFTFDVRGYSGFGSTLSERVSLLDLSDEEIFARSSKLRKENLSPKYNSKVSDGEIKNSLIMVEQLDDDAVSIFHWCSNDELLANLISLAENCGRNLYLRKHPLSKRDYDVQIYNQDVNRISSNDSNIYIIHNSGFAAELLKRGCKCILLAQSEFTDSYSVKSFDEIRRLLDSDELLNHYSTGLEIDFNRYLATLVHFTDTLKIKTVVSKFSNL